MDSKTKVVVYTVIAVVSMVCMTVAGIFIDADKWAKLAHWITDPATGTALVFLVGLVGAAIGRARHMPVSLLVLALLGSQLIGCGASALQTGALGVTVALRAEEAVDDVVQADLAAQIAACPAATPTDAQPTIDAHNTCVDHERAAIADATTVLDSIELAIRGVGTGIATAAELDANQPLPAVVASAIRDVLALFDRLEAILRARGVDIPSAVDLVVAALSALVPAEPAT